MLKSIATGGQSASDRVRPRITPENEPYYRALAEQRLMLPRCINCGDYHAPPVVSCLFCEASTEWVECTGTGVVHSWVRYHRAFMSEFEGLVPYVVITARIDNGPLLFGGWVESGAQPSIGQRVQAVSQAWPDGFCGLAFTPIEESI